jgi:hypothetical protein
MCPKSYYNFKFFAVEFKMVWIIIRAVYGIGVRCCNLTEHTLPVSAATFHSSSTIMRISLLKSKQGG